MLSVYTIGHSHLEMAQFVKLLEKHDISAIADVRSHPYSRYVPHYNRENLTESLKESGVHYVFLGKELGARQEDDRLYDTGGKVNFDKVSQTESFRSGLARVIKGAQSHKIALMCSEKNPLDCHRTHLVARNLVEEGVAVSHIMEDGRLENHADLIACHLGNQSDLFMSPEDAFYQKKGGDIAFKKDRA